MRKKIVAGNWKLNNDKHETAQLIEALLSDPIPSDVR